MIINKNSGDDLALSFQKLLNKHIKKYAHNTEDQTSAAEDQTSAAEDQTSAAEDQVSAAGDLLTNSVEDDALDSMISDDSIVGEQGDSLIDSDLEGSLGNSAEDWALDYAMDHTAQNIMKGLGKIAGSLKRKGEVFAADVVEATALSIRNDIVKEAKSKSNILNQLEKMASRLQKKGNHKAAKEVIKTASKIARS